MPAAAEIIDLTMDDGAVLRVRRHGNPSGPRLILCHGNGFATDAYFPFWRHLTDRFEIVLYDQRNHGWNPRHEKSGHTLANFAADLDRLLDRLPEAFGPRTTVGMLHSVSGITALRHALERSWRWDALVVFDPPMVPPPGHELHEVARDFEISLSEWSSNRPDRFGSPDELAERFARARSLSSWVPGAHELVARSILRRDEAAGNWALCCPRECESAIHVEISQLHFTDRLDELKGPVKFVCGDPNMERPQSPSIINAAMQEVFGYPYEMVPGTRHMLQIEEPEACVRIAVDFLNECGIG